MAYEILLHIGRHKSGTSSLQHALAANRPVLNRAGVLYPRSRPCCHNGIAHHALATACNPRLSGPDALTGIANALKAELQPHHRRILLSSEGFQNIGDLTRLRDFLDTLGASGVRIICYVREHLDYAMSSFRQLVHRQTRFATFAEYAAQFDDMSKFLGRWRDLGDLTLKWYDRALLKDGDIIADFCNEAEIPPAALSDIDRNPSIGGNLLVYKLAANQLNLKTAGYAALSELARDVAEFRTAFHIPDTAADRLRAGSAYNASLSSLLGEPRLKSFDDCEPLPQPETLAADLDRIMTGRPSGGRAQVLAQMAESSGWFSL